MTEVAERHYAELPATRLAGLAVTRHGYGRPTTRIPVIEAGHPVPDQAGISATKRALKLADEVDGEDLVLVLLSGGASANWIAPAPGLTLAEKQATTRALLKSGAAIGEMNTVRKHLSRIKGGRLAKRAYPAKVVTLAISDVPGDDPAVIGSGPTIPDPTTLADARAIVARYGLALPEAVRRALVDPLNETPKPGDEAFARSEYRIVARPADALAAAAERAQAAGYECVMLGGRLQGEAREVAAEHARLALSLSAEGRRAAVLSGGELTVTLARQGPRRPQPGICAGARHPSRRGPGNRRACRRYGRHRRRRRAPGRSGGRLCRPDHAQTGAGGRPRSRRVSRRQQFHGVFQWHRRSFPAWSDLYERDGLPRHRR